MTDLLSDTEYDIVVFFVNNNGSFSRIKRTRMVGQSNRLRREIVDRTLREVVKNNQVLVIEDGSISFNLSRITLESINKLIELNLKSHRELFSGIECMSLNSALTLKNLQDHARRTWHRA